MSHSYSYHRQLYTVKKSCCVASFSHWQGVLLDSPLPWKQFQQSNIRYSSVKDVPVYCPNRLDSMVLSIQEYVAKHSHSTSSQKITDSVMSLIVDPTTLMSPSYTHQISFVDMVPKDNFLALGCDVCACNLICVARPKSNNKICNNIVVFQPTTRKSVQGPVVQVVLW